MAHAVPVRLGTPARLMADGVDYFDDPDAPQANRIVPGADAVVVNRHGEILLIHRAGSDRWVLPGGAMGLGESLPAAARRATAAQTGFQIQITGLVGIYTDPRHVTSYPGDGEVWQEFAVVFTARPVGGELAPADQAHRVRWVPPGAVTGLSMDRSVRMRIVHYLAGYEKPHVG